MENSNSSKQQPSIPETQDNRDDFPQQSIPVRANSNTACTNLQPGKAVEQIDFIEFILPTISKQPLEKDGDPKEPEAAPIKDGEVKYRPIIPEIRIQKQTERFRRSATSKKSRVALETARLAQQKKRPGTPVELLYKQGQVREVLSRYQQVENDRKNAPKSTEQKAKATAQQLRNELLALSGSRHRASNLGRERSLLDIIKDLVEPLGSLPTPQGVSNNPLFAIGVEYAQQWLSRGYTTGRLLRSIALAPDESVEIVTKSWRKKTERRAEVTSVDEDISNEIVGDEKWSLATTKRVSSALSGEYSRNITGEIGLNITLPIEEIPIGAKANANEGANAEQKGNIEASIEATEEQIRNTTAKAARHLKTKSTSTVELASESGFENTWTRTLKNPNKCHSVNYHFFEVNETFEVTTSVASVDPYLLIPLPTPAITKEWVLCHECMLRKLLPCETYYAGFEAAKELLTNEKLGLFQGSLDDSVVTNGANAMEHVVIMLLKQYRKLSGSNPFFSGDLPSNLTNFIECIGNMFAAVSTGNIQEGINAFTSCMANTFGGSSEGSSSNNTNSNGSGGITIDLTPDCLDTAIGLANDGNWAEAVQVAINCGAEAIQALTSLNPPFEFLAELSSALPPFRPASSTAFVFANTAGFEPGPGSFLYWEILRIMAPELELALATLDARYSLVESMPEGAQRNRALVEAVATFINQVGDLQQAFDKVNMVASILSTGGIAALVALALPIPAVTLTAATAAILTTPLVMSLLAVVLFFVDETGMLDVLPDDEGMEQTMMSLYGHYLSMAQYVGEVAVLGANATLEERAQYESMLRQRRDEQRHYAKLRVEYERLRCHIKENIEYYAQSVWSTMTEAQITTLLSQNDIPLHSTQHTWSGFKGRYGILRITDDEALLGIDKGWEQLRRREGINKLFQRKQGPTPEVVTMPTGGMIVEPVLGECSGCEDFIREHRKLDIKMKEAEVLQAQLEAERLQKRLNSELLGDPTPYEGAASVSVSAEGNNEQS